MGGDATAGADSVPHLSPLCTLAPNEEELQYDDDWTIRENICPNISALQPGACNVPAPPALTFRPPLTSLAVMTSIVQRTVYRCLLRAVRQTQPPRHQPRLMQIVRDEFRCPNMAHESSLDDALEILRNLTCAACECAHAGPPGVVAELISEQPPSHVECSDQLLECSHQLLDVRPAHAFAAERMPCALNVPWDDGGCAASFVLRAAELGIRPASRIIIVGGEDNDEAAHAAVVAFRDVLGADVADQVVLLEGGFAAWREQGLATEVPTPAL